MEIQGKYMTKTCVFSWCFEAAYFDNFCNEKKRDILFYGISMEGMLLGKP